MPQKGTTSEFPGSEPSGLEVVIGFQARAEPGLPLQSTSKQRPIYPSFWDKVHCFGHCARALYPRSFG